MRSKFDEQLKKLNQELLYMGTMIEENIQQAIESGPSLFLSSMRSRNICRNLL